MAQQPQGGPTPVPVISTIPTAVQVPNNTPFVRAYRPEDFENVLDVFRTTADLSLPPGPLLHTASYLYLRPYTYFHTSECVCLVLDDGRGAAVGYIIGAKDTHSFSLAWRESYLPSLSGLSELSVMGNEGGQKGRELRKELWGYEGGVGLDRRWSGLGENFPAHLHINLLPAYQRHGHGRKLMHAFCDVLRAQHIPGVHLGMVASNAPAEKFYVRMGFERFPQVMDGGVTGQLGRTAENTLYLVGKLD